MGFLIKVSYLTIAWALIWLAIDILMKMLAKDPKNRISAKECLEHSWIVSGGTTEHTEKQPVAMLSSAQENMKRFQEEWEIDLFILILINWICLDIDLT